MNVTDKLLRPGLFVRWLAWVWVRLRRINEQKYRDAGWASYAEKLHYKILKLRLSSKNFQRVKDRRLDFISQDSFMQYCGSAKHDAGGVNPEELCFKHSGSGGDIIYALPAMKALSQNRKAKLFLDPSPCNVDGRRHPFNAQMASLLIPLLEHQSWLASVQIYQGEKVDHNLDLFRRIPSINTGQSSIAHWYFWLFAVSADLSVPWLEVPASRPPGKNIVLARSPRYRNSNINYAFLQDFGEIDFVGMPDEFKEMKAVLPKLQYVECKDFLAMAEVIKTARFFIGNQSFPYACAEAIKVPRILEVFPRLPDVIPTGANTGEAFFQPNFEKLVKEFWERTNR